MYAPHLFERFYRENPPKPFVYYLFYPLLLPYWLLNRTARRELLLYRGLTVVGFFMLEVQPTWPGDALAPNAYGEGYRVSLVDSAGQVFASISEYESRRKSPTLEVVERLCPLIAILDEGHLKGFGPLEDLKRGGESLEQVFVDLVGGAQKGNLSWL